MSIAVLASHVATFGIISSAVPATVAFTPTSDATYVVAVVGWASSDPMFLPVVTFDGTIMQGVSSPFEIDADRGAIVVFVTEVVTPITGPVDVVVSCAPNFMGNSAIAIHSFSGSGKLLGKIAPGQIGNHDAGEISGTITLPSISAGSVLIMIGTTFFGTNPVNLSASGGWIKDGQAGQVNASIVAFHTLTDLQTITITDTSTFFYMLNLAYEVLDVGAIAPTSTVTITNSMLADLNVIGLNPVTVTFDAQGGSLVMIAAARTNNVSTGPAAFTYDGQAVAFLPDLALRNTDTGTAMDVAFIANPSAGVLEITGEGPTGYFGYTELYVVAFGATSGVVGVRKSAIVNGNGTDMGLAASTPGSLLLAIVSTIFPKATEVPNYGWQTVQQDSSNASINAWILKSVGSATNNLVLSASGFAGLAVSVFEFLVHDERSANCTAVGNASLAHGVPAGIGSNLGTLTPAGQRYHVYWESWEDVPFKLSDQMKPDDFFLSRIPSSVTSVLLSFAMPLFTYANLDSDVKATTGLDFPGSMRVLKGCIDLLHTRNPTIEVWLAVQQVSNTVNNQPYNPDGWGGLTSDNVAAMKRFVDDFGLTGVIIDYEVISSDDAQHCTRHPDGTVTCYTDAELLATIKTMRAGLPRPIQLVLDALHVGAYGIGQYLNAVPNGFNSGYDVCIANDPVALAALDAVHIMSYDAGSEYDPRVVARAFQSLFPTLPLYLGLRVGPPQFQGVKQTTTQMRDYINTVLMLGMAGMHMYSGMWDVVYIGRNNPAFDPPFGNYNRDFPDASIAGALVAEMLHLGDVDVPAGVGYVGKGKDMRMLNRPPAASIGAVHLF